MNSKAGKIGKRAAVIALVLVIVAAAVLAIVLPRKTVAAVATDNAIDGEALGALSRCEAYAAGHDFDTQMTGTVKARVFGLPFSQSAHGGRTVREDCVTDTAESLSTFVKAAFKKECRADECSACRGEYKNGAFVYGKPALYDRAGFTAAYGKPPTGIVKYELDGTVIGAVKLDDNLYRFTLDPVRATAFSRNEVKSVLGAKTYPEYRSVEITLKTDGERALEITSTEKFYIDKFGGTTVTAEYTEKFIYN